MEIELSDSEAENATLIGDHLQQVVETVIVGVPTILEVYCMCMFMHLGRILLQGSILINLFDPVRLQVDLQRIEVDI